MIISDRDLADLAIAGLLDFHKTKLEGQEFLDESRAKKARDSQKSNEKPNRPIYVLGCDSNCSDDEGKDVYTAEFVKFTGDDSRTILEHIGQFIMQCGEASTSDIYKLRLFPLSLLGAAFTRFISLPPNSVRTWADLEQKFYDYLFNGETELKLSHLTLVKQKIHENISEYIRRFRDTRN